MSPRDSSSDPPPSQLPSVDRVVRGGAALPLIATHGRAAVIDAIRAVLELHRERRGSADQNQTTEEQIVEEVAQRLEDRAQTRLRPVLNLTGTVLHTNLGRALLSEAAIRHTASAMRASCNLEFDLGSGKRGERDQLIEGLLTELTGAEAATVVNNNAAAVVLALSALASRREVLVSRGELIEIGGSFRIPDIMRCANTRLIEVGTTNRTHAADFEAAISPSTAALMKVHASNYQITGFVAEVPLPELADIAHRHQLPLIADLGAGSLIDLSAFGIPKEPVVRESLANGCDLVTFSGDKLLGGPQAGLIVGRKALIERINRHPLKRALRVSKLTLAALEATLLAYRTPDFLQHELPTLRLLVRPVAELEAQAQRLCAPLAKALGDQWQVSVQRVNSQVGSGSLTAEHIESAALTIGAVGGRSGSALNALAARLRRLPTPIIGRVADQQLLLDVRCLEDEPLFLSLIEQLPAVDATPRS